ncbi:hypothetical protein ACFQY5_41265 [Paeniroseomonas aquatica]|uniref:Uncharacterized protein n=1 Tax=Paeniroseomonas aquatica TaxID=373043 RepID=A0ABT8AG56_9PROT|nr:hypothetical protein [Paeniroseomonas aquatica]MDN3568668.1 hypothetical protein [Paeniroseomonas aquatica]
MAETLTMAQDKGGAMAQAVGQRLRLVQQARSMLPALQPDMQRAVALYGRKVREGMPLADAVARFSDFDRRNGQPARAAEWQQRLSAEAKAPAPAIEVQLVQKIAPKLGMRMSR